MYRYRALYIPVIILKDFVWQDTEDLELLETEEQQKELELGRGNRARKEVAYQEQLSERDWLKVIQLCEALSRLLRFSLLQLAYFVSCNRSRSFSSPHKKGIIF